MFACYHRSAPDGTKKWSRFTTEKEKVKSLGKQYCTKWLKKGPKLSVGNGALGFWAAFEEELPGCEERCWVHKTTNILDKMAKSVQVDAN